MKLNKKYILFDNDGVLVHTEPLYFKANQLALKDLHIDLSFERYLKFMNYGGTIWDLAKEKNIDETIIKKQQIKRNHYYQTLLKTENIEIKGVEKVLYELSKKYKLAIVTTSKRADFDLIHKDRGLLKYIDFTLCLNEYKKVKPFPDPYLEAMLRFNGTLDECIIIEDSLKGLTSALNAKIDCITVFNEFTQKQDFSQATYRIKNITELLNLL